MSCFQYTGSAFADLFGFWLPVLFFELGSCTVVLLLTAVLFCGCSTRASTPTPAAPGSRCSRSLAGSGSLSVPQLELDKVYSFSGSGSSGRTGSPNSAREKCGERDAGGHAGGRGGGADGDLDITVETAGGGERHECGRDRDNGTIRSGEWGRQKARGERDDMGRRGHGPCSSCDG